MKPVEIELLHSVSRPTVHPDGSRAVVAVSHPHLDSDSNVGQLWMVPIDGSGARRFTRGVNDFSPRFSPDGRVIAFLRATPGNPPQLHLLDSGGGEPMRITDQKLGVSEFSWSEDSTRIAFVARVPEPGRYGTVDDIGGGAEPGRHITGLRYKSNGLGYTNDRRSQLFLVKVPSLSLEPSYEPAPLPDGSKPPVSHVPDALQLTHGDYDVSSPRFLGERAAFVSARHESRDRDLRNQIWAVGLDGTSDPEALTPTESPIGIGTFEPSSRGIHFVGQDTGASGTDFVAKNAALYRLNDSGPVQLTDPETTDFADGSLTVLQDSVLATDRSRGTQQLVEVGDGTSRRLTSGDVMVLGHDAANGEIVVSYATPDTFGDVGVLRDGELTRLTDFSAALRETDLIMPTELLVSGRDGYDIHGWVAKPQTEGPHPTFLLIHGGPFADYNVQVFDEVQVLVEAGYAVVYCNPRGSAGYGQDHGLAIRQAMGTVDLHDVIDFLDGALDGDSTLDRERLGILGGSYGGYLTAWTIAHDHRFKAAIVERGFLDPEAFVGSSDIGWFFPHEYNGTDKELIRSQSPQAVADRVQTPTLVIHSEDDLRCPIGQAETYYATLKLGGVDAEMLVFPGENHELSRSGRPRHRVQRFEAILDWLAKHV